MKRALALVAAVAMVGGSLLVRSRGDGATSGSDGGDTEIVLACVTELADECNKLVSPTVQVRIEDAGKTATSLDGIDGWVTLDPWPAIADLQAHASRTGTPVRVASSPLVIAMVAERTPRLAPCAGTIGWHCLGDSIGQRWSDVGGDPRWGPVTVGLPPTTTATGLLLLGQATAGYFGHADIATNDFDADDLFGPWLAKLKRSQVADPFGSFILQFPAKFSAVGVVQAEEQRGVGSKAVTVIEPTPPARAVVVVVAINGAPGAKRVASLARSGALRDALKERGWSVDAVAGTSGLPDAGVLLALSTK